FSAGSHAHFAGFYFLIANHQQEWHLLQSVFADLGVHFFVARVDIYAHSGGLQRVRNLLRVSRMALRNGNHDNLHRRQPYWEIAGIMLDQYAEEAFYAAVERAMHH